MSKKVDIIVVNWNSGLLTLQAVSPYVGFENNEISCHVIVVDNGSEDDSLALLKNKVPDLISNKENMGFGKACNEAFLQCKGDYILLLNPDTSSSPKVLEKLVLFLETNPSYAVVGPQQTDEKGNIATTCGRFPAFSTAIFELLGLSKVFPKIFTPVPIMTDWNHMESKDVDHVMGSYMLIRRSVLDITGFMDDAYFVYGEDIDLSRRIQNAGYKVYYTTECTIIHEGGGTGRKVKTERLFYSLVSRRIYWKKHLGKASSFILTFFSITVEPFLRIIDSSIKEKKLVVKRITKAYSLYLNKIFRADSFLH